MRTGGTRRSRCWLAVASVGVLTFLAIPGVALGQPAAAGHGADVAATTPVNWGPCDADLLTDVPPGEVPKYSCARYRVPIDHDNAAVGTVDIAMMRRAANQPDTKIGSLFLNPGGPGGSGLEWAKTTRLNPEVRDRFDLIGFDPRGVGRSNPLRCFTTKEDADQLAGRRADVPISQPEISDTLASYRDYGQFCQRNAGELLRHMSTKDVVKDLDTLRAAVGDEKLNYTGFSYGTLIGSTYAAMYPDRVRAIIIDGNVDPALRTSDGRRYDRERAHGFEIALDGFLTECQSAGEACAFSEGQPRQKFDELRDRLRQESLTLPDGTTMTISQFTAGVSSALYRPPFQQLATQLQTAYEVLHPKPAAKVVTKSDVPLLLAPQNDPRHDADPDSPYTADDSYFGVNCSDKPFRYGQEQVPGMAAEWDRESPTFGRLQAFSDPAACPAWPVHNEGAFTGPWHAETATPVLVVGNYYDPATQYEFAKRMAAELGNSRLLSVDAFGHCILGSAKGVDDAAAAYLIDLRVPPGGQVYQPNAGPFDPEPAPKGT